MAELRIAWFALAAAVTAACDRAGAQPAVSSGLAPPAGWQPLPELVAAVTAAAVAPKASVLGAEAWGETSRGCYAVWIAIQGGPSTTDHVLAGLAGASIATGNVVKPTTPDGVVSATFSRGDYHGHVRARIAGSEAGARVTALACFANQREPAICERACAPLLGAFK